MPETPPHQRRATALRYEHGDVAPRIAATGSGYLAERIIAAARDAGVPVREDKALVEALAMLELGQPIPAELWRAVAEVLAWAYKLDGTAAARRRA